MGIEIEIERAVKRTVALDKDSPTKSDSEQERIISDVKSALDNSTFNFENTNYGELRYLLDTGLIETNTEKYLKNIIDDAFDRAKIDKPYFLMGGVKLDCGYNLYGNMKANKTILLVDRISGMTTNRLWLYVSKLESITSIQVANGGVMVLL